ncbi:MAG: MBL fold metallo-hydrolase [Blautia sp.]|nr:MBL fold metallo-hydrolase [Blautia sp.]
MKITSLVENTSKCELMARHGLSLYIETQSHKILFDLGPDRTLFDNAKKRNIDLAAIDTVIISHGHTDHGGALRDFLKINNSAGVYIRRNAFEPHYSKTLFLKIPVGIDKALKTHPQIILTDGDYRIDDELFLFTVSETGECHSTANNVLYDKNGRDNFSHEQNLVITENPAALIMGCGHTGVVNIMNKAKHYQPKICVGGFHLYNPITKKCVPAALLNEIACALNDYRDTEFYTCHCTGKKAFEYLSKQMPNLFYLSCGETIAL